MSGFESIARWWVVVSILAVAFAPLTIWLGAGLGTTQYALMRPVGVIVATFIIWWPAALFGLPFTGTILIVGLIVVGVASWVLLLRSGNHTSSVHWQWLLGFEAIWLLTFLAYLWFRSANPAIVNTEKPMEIALLSSVSRSSQVPAPDPWLAGESINYYYFGYQVFGSIVKLSGIPTAIAFNLALGTAFASLVTAAAGLGSALARFAKLRARMTIIVSALASVLLAFAGNLETMSRLIRDPVGTLAAGWWDGVGWQASRIIYDRGVHGNPQSVETINEFPAFSFILGDLHPHLITYPALLTTVALAIGFVLVPASITTPRTALVGAFAGLLYASNSWDAPVGVAILIAAIGLALRDELRSAIKPALTVLFGAIIAALPFALHYTAPVGVNSGSVPAWIQRLPIIGTVVETVAIVDWRPSSAGELLTVHGVWIAIFAVFAVAAFSSDSRALAIFRHYSEIWITLALVLLAIALAWMPALVLLGIPLIAAALIVMFDYRPQIRLVGALYVVGFGLALIPEFFYIQDSFGSRLNTIFKLYFQAWLFLALASAIGIGTITSIAPAKFKVAMQIVVTIAVLAALPYSFLSAQDWMDMGPDSRTLNGAAYIRRLDPATADALTWLNDNADANDVIVEAPGCAYQNVGGIPTNRFSAFTGLPTIIGWTNHELQWRRGQKDVISSMLSAPSGELNPRQIAAMQWLDGEPTKTGAYPAPRFIIYGNQERNASSSCTTIVEHTSNEMQKLIDQGWVVAFEEGPTRILTNSSNPLASR